MFGRAYAHLKNRIINKIGEMIRNNPDFSADCIYVADYEQPSVKDPDLLKIYVSFEKEEDLCTFQKLKVVEIITASKEKFVFNITQPDI